MLRDGKLLAFADDIIISINPNETAEIPQAINHIASFRLITNPLKCHYLSPQKIPRTRQIRQTSKQH